MQYLSISSGPCARSFRRLILRPMVPNTFHITTQPVGGGCYQVRAAVAIWCSASKNSEKLYSSIYVFLQLAVRWIWSTNRAQISSIGQRNLFPMPYLNQRCLPKAEHPILAMIKDIAAQYHRGSQRRISLYDYCKFSYGDLWQSEENRINSEVLSKSLTT
jgi:hypothetical protein